VKKPLVIVGLVIGGLVLLVAVFVAVIAGIAYYSIYKSDAAETARTFLRENEKLKQDIGEVKDFGRLISGQVNSGASGGQATLEIKVYGERKTVPATVTLISKANRGWRVTRAEYINDQGRRVVLFDPYEEPVEPEPDQPESEAEPAKP
jgi:hypothetical protein